jgi:enamine deaminase RidA (YjgF/YER057c/UK114 family)
MDTNPPGFQTERSNRVLKSLLLLVMTRAVQILLLTLLLACGLFAQKSKNKKPDEEPRPQVLEVLPEPPEAIAVETGRLSFQVSPLSDKGLLSQQVRDALKAIARLNHGATIVKLRAFVAGSGDLRRVKDIVAEELTDRKQPLPAVSTIQVGALPLVGAQVVLEAISSEKKIVNPNGLAFASATDAQTPAAAVAQLRESLDRGGIKGPQVLGVTCFLGSLTDLASARAAATAAFPAAAANFVQSQRLSVEAQVACEAVGRLDQRPAAALLLANRVASVNTPKLVLTGTQLIFRDQDADFRLAYQRLGKAIGALGASMQDVLWSGAYTLTKPDAARIETIQWEFLNRTHSPAGAALQVEGLPSTDATAAIEFIAVGH